MPTKTSKIEITPEVVAFARAVLAQVEKDNPPPPPRVNRVLFNVRTKVIHNHWCRSAGGCVPLTGDQIYAITDEPWGCLVCDTFNHEEVYDTVEIQVPEKRAS